jgi:hypothetical protein
MPESILNCVICGKPVALAEAKTDADGKAVHEECLLSEYVAISPMTLACPRCGALPGQVCELFDGEVELVHVERIKMAAARGCCGEQISG